MSSNRANEGGTSNNHTTTADPSSPDHADWQRGREQRVRVLEAALEAATTRQSQTRRQPPQQRQSDHDYGTMLDSESDDDSDSDARTRGDDAYPDPDPNSDAASCSSSILYSEGQPLLCTYQPPTPLGTNTAPPNSYGLLRGTGPVKTSETFLPWDTRLRDSLRRMGCCCNPPAS
ncbi:hypothetical protein GGH94_002720 [Coemansia aciculifera]|uniref:Uncharacterized protein n=1 Tax=Coemansia aciculifera TaxID=417176 RepID=A0A9W8ILG7_9FUNG|nr:hypothetical protein GGH94_002720 [Coemansia aciculifera]KAJ2872114.1 hypothetical protein GGH93_004286 [Coemansia aciculifera]